MDRSTLSKYEHQFELDLVNEAVENETEELKRLKYRYRKSWGIPTVVPVVKPQKRKKIVIRTIEDRFRAVQKRPQKVQMKKVDEMEPTGMGKVWMTKRRVDGKIFLAQEFEDDDGLLEVVTENLLRLLNHNNLVSLIDIVQPVNADPAFMVWEYCQSGTLSRVLRICGSKGQKMPESFCWHVLHSLTQALLWLHKGVKIDPVTEAAVSHDDDWHTVLVGDIRPTNIFFAAAQGTRPFGPAKLGCFSSATVCADSKAAESNERPAEFTSFQPPEIVEKFRPWTPEAEIWNLGAVVYHMMVGHPPDLELSGAQSASPERAWMSKIPSNFTIQLRDSVMWMLVPEPEGRPSILRFWSVMNQNFLRWQEITMEGRHYEAACRGVPR